MEGYSVEVTIPQGPTFESHVYATNTVNQIAPASGGLAIPNPKEGRLIVQTFFLVYSPDQELTVEDEEKKGAFVWVPVSFCRLLKV